MKGWADHCRTDDGAWHRAGCGKAQPPGCASYDVCGLNANASPIVNPQLRCPGASANALAIAGRWPHPEFIVCDEAGFPALDVFDPGAGDQPAGGSARKIGLTYLIHRAEICRVVRISAAGGR